jgi:hypothetical protein
MSTGLQASIIATLFAAAALGLLALIVADWSAERALQVEETGAPAAVDKGEPATPSVAGRAP